MSSEHKEGRQCQHPWGLVAAKANSGGVWRTQHGREEGRWVSSHGHHQEPVGRGLKHLLMKAKEESEDPGLKLNTQKTKILASGPITSWQTDGEIVETVADFNFLGSKITADSDYSHE